MARVYYEQGGYYVDSDAVIPGAVRIVSTAAGLRSESPVGGTPVRYTEGRLSSGDGGGGFWTWDPASSLADNGASVVASSSLAIGRWKKDGTTTITASVRDFGATGDGITDDTPAFLAALQVLRLTNGGVLYAPRPAVAYMLQEQHYSYGARFPSYRGVVEIDFSKLTVLGDPGGSLLRLRTPGGGNPDTAFKLVPQWAFDDPSAVPTPPAAWQPSHAYIATNRVVGPGGYDYYCITPGTSGLTGPIDINPATCADVTDGTVHWILAAYVYRGNMFRIKSFATGATPSPTTDILFKNIIFDGQAPRQETLWPLATHPTPEYTVVYDRAFTYPGGPPVPAGAGWNTPFGHTPVAMPPPYTYGDVTFEDCEFRNWRSELYRSDSLASSGQVTIRDCKFDSFAGDAISMTCKALVERVEISDTWQAIEMEPAGFDQTFRDVYVHDGGMGFTFAGLVASYENRGHLVIENCKAQRCSQAGLFFSDYMANVSVKGFDAIDASQLSGFAAVMLTSSGSVVTKNMDMGNIRVIGDRRGCAGAFSVVASSATVRNSSILRTPYAVTNGILNGPAMGGGTVAASDVLRVIDCDFQGAGSQGNLTSGAGLCSCERVKLAADHYQLNVTDLDVNWHTYYEFKPSAGGGARTLDTPKHFPASLQVRVVIDANVTIKNNALIALTGGVDCGPLASGGEIVLVSPAGRGTKVYEVSGMRVTY